MMLWKQKQEKHLNSLQLGDLATFQGLLFTGFALNQGMWGKNTVYGLP